jgi:hypothetical protein
MQTEQAYKPRSYNSANKQYQHRTQNQRFTDRSGQNINGPKKNYIRVTAPPIVNLNNFPALGPAGHVENNNAIITKQIIKPVAPVAPVAPVHTWSNVVKINKETHDQTNVRKIVPKKSNKVLSMFRYDGKNKQKERIGSKDSDVCGLIKVDKQETIETKESKESEHESEIPIPILKIKRTKQDTLNDDGWTTVNDGIKKEEINTIIDVNNKKLEKMERQKKEIDDQLKTYITK